MRRMSFLAVRQLRQNPTLPTITRLFFSSTSNSSVPSSTAAPTFLPPLQTIAGTQSHAASGNHQRRVSFSSGLSAIAIFLGGAVMLHETTYADAGFEGNQMPETASSIDAIEKLASKERKRLEDMISEQGLPRGTLPPFSVSVKGSKIIIKFQVPQNCEVPHLIVNVASNLGLKADHHGGSEMILRAWDSAVAWQVALYPLESLKKNQEEGNLPKSTDLSTESLCIFIFKSLLSSKDSEIEFIKKGSFEQKELEAIVAALRLSISHENQKKQSENKSWGNSSRRNGRNDLPASAEKTVATLEAMGVRVYGSDMSHGVSVDGTISWDNIAGYEHQKREIEDTLLLALQNPELYDEIAHATRQKFESNRPRAVLFEGPPGTGKTSCARVIANQAGVPLLYVPLEVVMSKYYGESERLLGSVFSLANEFPNGAIIFLDEIDSFAAARDNEMHEATRRLLSVILRQIDGFEQEKRVIVVAATNRKEDLDPALISRFDSMIFFGLPDQKNREEIAAQYAKHLNKPELVKLAAATEEMSGRDIRDVCQQAERSWASKIIRGEAPKDDMSRSPPLEEYIRCAEIRRKSLIDAAAKKGSVRTGLNRMPLGLL